MFNEIPITRCTRSCVILTIAGAPSDKNVLKMTFPFQWGSPHLIRNFGVMIIQCYEFTHYVANGTPYCDIDLFQHRLK